jgi:hypothetical protein
MGKSMVANIVRTEMGSSNWRSTAVRDEDTVKAIDAGGAQASGLPVGAALPRKMVERARSVQMADGSLISRERGTPGQPLSSFFIARSTGGCGGTLALSLSTRAVIIGSKPFSVSSPIPGRTRRHHTAD